MRKHSQTRPQGARAPNVDTWVEFRTRRGECASILMAIGAVFAALNTMYAAVVTRTVEIATLRALGFGSVPVISVMIESMALARISHQGP